MKYFIDTEFIEGFHKPRFGKRRHFIDIISIGIACEDGREYYMLSREYNFKDADKWVQENVIIPAYKQMVHGDMRNSYSADNFHHYFGKSNAGIRQDLFDFITYGHHKNFKGELIDPDQKPLEVYGYYSDYDWVLFCSLFGRMIDLPKGFPMYCLDLKQMMHERGLSQQWKQRNCPDPADEHNALVDARWNRDLFNKIQSNTKS